jgi:hypothetical protein
MGDRLVDVEEFVGALKRERDSLLATYLTPEPASEVGALLAQAGLDSRQRESVHAALDAALTDAFYTILLGLDGAASIGGIQQRYRIEDESGAIVSEGNGELEGAAYEAFQQD